MLNPYAVRPIGSERFYEHLKDIQTRSYYNTELPVDPPVIITGGFPWSERGSFKTSGYEELYLAIVASTFIEYLSEYRSKTIREEKYGRDAAYWVHNSRCIDLENFYFRQNDFLSKVFDDLLEYICWEGVNEIEKCMDRLQVFIRWTRKKNHGEDN